MNTDAIPLPSLPRALHSLTGQQPPSYKTLYLDIVNGNIPEAEQRGSRWVVPRDALPSIAQRFGLITTPQQKAA